MTSKRGDTDFLKEIRTKLYVAVVSDVLDSLGYTDQAMSSRIRPLDDSLVLVGYTRTGLYQDIYHVTKGENPYELEIALIDDLHSDEVPVFACGASGRIAPWGELLSTASRARGAAGCVTDGLTRDIRAIKELRFPVFHGGIAPLDSKGRGKASQIDVPIVCGGVRIETGDLIFGDADGVVVIPKSIEQRVIASAFAKVAGEDKTRQDLADGVMLREVFNRYGVL
jgi:4-hydroxy-4-methyl-2-oxoglutarate aldolase